MSFKSNELRIDLLMVLDGIIYDMTTRILDSKRLPISSRIFSSSVPIALSNQSFVCHILQRTNMLHKSLENSIDDKFFKFNKMQYKDTSKDSM